MLSALIGSAGANLLYGLAILLDWHGDIVRHRKATEAIEIVALVLALFAGTEFVVASLGHLIDQGIRNLAGLIPGAGGFVILFLVAVFLSFKVGKALVKQGRASLFSAFSLALLLGAFPGGTWPAVIYGYLSGPANMLTAAIMSHI